MAVLSFVIRKDNIVYSAVQYRLSDQWEKDKRKFGSILRANNRNCSVYTAVVLNIKKLEATINILSRTKYLG